MKEPARHQSAHRAGPRRFRRLRKVAVSLVVLLTLVLGGMWLLTRSWFIAGRLQPQLQAHLGGDVELGSAVYDGDGKFLIQDLVIRSPEHVGRAGEVVSVGDAILVVDPDLLLRGKVQIQRLELDNVVLRLSEDANRNGSFSIMSLKPKTTDQPKPKQAPPYVKIHKAIVEVGIHHGAEYRAVGRRHVTGMIAPLDLEEPGWFSFRLRELGLGGQERPDGVAVNGRWNAFANKLTSTVSGLELDQRTYEVCPSIVRLWWDQMELEGRVGEATIGWDEDASLSVEFDIETMSMTLPVDAGIFWAHYRGGQVLDVHDRPRMRVHGGTMRLARDRLALQGLQGDICSAEGDDIVSVPYEVSLDIPKLPGLDWDNRQAWFGDVLEQTPFTLSIALDDLALEATAQERSPTIGLPRAVARLLAGFNMTDWKISSGVTIKREAPSESMQPGDMRLDTSGFVHVQRARGAFKDFPYVLDGINAYVEIHNDLVTVHRLEGLGSNGVPVKVHGQIELTPENQRNVGIDLHIHTKAAPVDQRLHDALGPMQQDFYDLLVDQASATSLDAAGLLDWKPNEAVDTAIERLSRYLEEQGHSEEPERLALLQAGLTRLQSEAERPTFDPQKSFALGGEVDVDLNVRRQRGPDNPMRLHGQIAMRNAGMIFKSFPYPLWVLDGVFNWQPGRLTIVETEEHPGLTMVTPAGGFGQIRGKFMFNMPGDENTLHPDLDIRVVADQINAPLLAAIPPERSIRQLFPDPLGWAGVMDAPGADVIRQLHLRGDLKAHGVVVNQEGRLRHSFQVDLDDATASPSDAFLEAVSAKALPILQGWSLDNGDATLLVDNEGVRLESLTIARDDCQIQAKGTLSDHKDPEASDLWVRFENLTLDGPTVAELTASEDGTTSPGLELWQRLHARGFVDSEVNVTGLGHDNRSATIGVWPRTLQLNGVGQTLDVTTNAGSILIGPRRVDLRDLSFDIQRGTRNEGTLTLGGTRLGETTARWQLEGTWNGRFECPLLEEVVSTLGNRADNGLFERLQPEGAFVGAFEVDSGGESGVEYRCRLTPKTLSVQLEAGAAKASFDPGGTVLLQDGRCRLQGLAGTIDDSKFQIDGTLDLQPMIRSELQIAFDGQLEDPHVYPILPATMRRFLDGIEFVDGPEPGSSRIRDGQLLIEQVSGPDPTGPTRWRSMFQGALLFDDASFTAGADFSGLDGRFDIRLNRVPDAELELVIDCSVDALTVLKQPLRDVQAQMHIDPKTGALQIEDLRGDLHGGLVCSRATIGVGDDLDYQMEINLVGADAHRMLGQSTGAEVDTTLEVGRVFAGIRLSGERGKLLTRRGRGEVRVLGGISQVPLVLKVIQLAHLTSPVVGDLGYAESNFYISGHDLHFERLLFESVLGDLAPMQLIGEGSLDLDRLVLDTRFRQRGGWAIVGDLVGGISDQLYVIEITGPPSDPSVNVVPLPGLARREAEDVKPW